MRPRRPTLESLEFRTLLSFYAVSTLLDNNDGNIGPGNLSLREAILLANANPGEDQISLPAGTYNLTIAGALEDLGKTGDLDITDNLRLVGAGRDTTTINAAGLDRVLDIWGDGAAETTVTISGLKITGGSCPYVNYSRRGGGGIAVNYASLTLDDCVISNNRTGETNVGGRGDGGEGGGIAVSVGRLTVINSVVEANRAGDDMKQGSNGGGIAGYGSTITIRDSIIRNNRSGVCLFDQPNVNSHGRGGGIYSISGATNIPLPGILTIVNTIVSGNTAGDPEGAKGDGGGIFNAMGSSFELRNATISGNTGYFGGGIGNDNGKDGTIIDSTIEGNTATGGRGGGLYSESFRISVISGTSIIGNRVLNADDNNSGGGGIYNVCAPFFSEDPSQELGEIVNSTISGNQVLWTSVATGPFGNARGGGIYNQGQIGRIANTTVAGNSARIAGGIYHITYVNYEPIIGEMVNTLIADNMASETFPRDFLKLGTVISASCNLIEDPNGHDFVNGADGNIIGIDPKLAPLAANGGMKETQTLQAGSVAIDAGRNAGAPATDQRGYTRPFNDRVDIGALEVQPLVNAPPVATGGSLITDEDRSVRGVVQAVDADGDPLTFAVGAGPGHGTLRLNPSDGTFTYTPAANYVGPDGFTVRAIDRLNISDAAAWVITVSPVNDAPVALDAQFAVDEDTTRTGQVVATDVDGDSLSFTLSVPPAHGRLDLKSNGRFTYSPAYDFYGSDAFTVVASDGVLSDAATVSVDVRPVNDTPFPLDDAYTVGKNNRLVVAAPQGVLANDFDIDGDPLTAIKVSDPKHGRLVLNADGSFTYSPFAGYFWNDSFSYRPGDGAAVGAIATVRLTIAATDSSTAKLRVTAPSQAIAGMPFQVTVTALDASGRLTESYIGRVHFAADAAACSLPADYTFVPGDGGIHTFLVTCGAGGGCTIDVTDGTASGGATLTVDRQTSTADVSAVSANLVYGQSLTLRARVTTPGGGRPTGGTVRFAIDGVDIGTAVDIVGGQADSAAVGGLGAGNHTVSAYYSGDIATIPATATAATVSISRAPLSVVAADQDRIYGQPNPAFSASYTGFVLGQDASALSGSLSFTTTATQASAVGSYPITPTGLSSPNYAIQFVPGTLRVAPASLTVTTLDATRPYGSPNPAFSASYSGFVLGQDAAALGGSLRMATAAGFLSDVGSYPIEASGLASPNYAIRYVPGALTVVRVPLTVTADERARTYGQPNPTFSAWYSGFVLGQGSSVLSGVLSFTTTATQASAVGSYPITPTGLASPNYTIQFVPGTLRVAPASLTVTALDATRPYGAANPALSASYSGFVLGQDVAALGGSLRLATAAGQASDVGSYPIEASGLASPNYAIRYVPGALAVTPAPLTVAADARSRTYGDPNPPLSASYSGFVLGQDAGVLGGAPSLATDATRASHVGTYPIRVSGLTSRNYAITYVPGTLEVTPAPLTVAADSKARLAGRPNPELTVSYQGFVNGDTEASLTRRPSLSTAAAPASPAGAYPIVAAGAASPDYTIRHVDGTLTVDPAPVTVARVSVQAIKSKRVRKTLIVVEFSDALDPASARSLGNYGLTTIPANKRQRPKTVKLAGAAYDATTRTVTLTTSKPLVLNPPLQLRITGAGLLDARGRSLDGDRDGLPGGDALAVLRTKGVTLS